MVLSPEDFESLADYDDQVLFFPVDKRLQWFVKVPISFHDREIEEAFRANQLLDLKQRTRPILCCALAALVLFTGVASVNSGVFRQSSPNLFRSQYLQFASLLGVILVTCFLLLTWKNITEIRVMLYAMVWQAVLLASRFRAAAITGEDPRTVYPYVSETELMSDSLPLIACSGVLMVFMILMPVRCTRSLMHVFLIPLCYAAVTLPLPDGFEGGIARRTNIIARLWIVAWFGFAGRVQLDNSARAAFLSRIVLGKSLAREKVLRFSAEHEAERGPFSASRTRDRSDPDPQGSESASTRHWDDAKSQLTERTGLSTMIFTMGPPRGLDVEQREELAYKMLLAMQKKGREEGWLISEELLEICQGRDDKRGGFGIVRRGRYARTEVALKLPLSTPEFDFEFSESLANEIRLLRRLRHPHIISFLGACIIPATAEIVLVEELGPSTSLHKIESLPGLRSTVQENAHRILSDVCHALCYLHALTPAMVHGDLKPDNVLVDGTTQKTKLIDFGLSQLQKRNWKGHMGGSTRWMAPEILVKKSSWPAPDAATDIFSFGRVAFFTVTALLPLQDTNHEFLFSQAELGLVPELQWSEAAVELPLLEKCRELCERCLAFEAVMRPTALELLLDLERWPREDQDQEESSKFRPLKDALKSFKQAEAEHKMAL